MGPGRIRASALRGLFAAEGAGTVRPLAPKQRCKAVCGGSLKPLGPNLRPGDSRCRHHFPQFDREGPESPWNTEHIDAGVSPPFTRVQMTDFFSPLGSLCLIQCLKQFKRTKVLTSSFALSKTSGKLNCHFLVSTPNIHHGGKKTNIKKYLAFLNSVTIGELV